MQTVVTRKNGYTINAQVNEKTKKLHNFSVDGVGASKTATYITILEAESVINHLTKEQERKFEKNRKK